MEGKGIIAKLEELTVAQQSFSETVRVIVTSWQKQDRTVSVIPVAARVTLIGIFQVNSQVKVANLEDFDM